MPDFTVLIDSISVPLQVGIYNAECCIDRYEIDGQTSAVLLQQMEKIFEQYSVSRIIYVNGPGSYMAIKLTYIMLQTIKLIRGIEFDGCSAFELNGGNPVRAMGSLYFIKEKETIITKKFDEKVKQEFWLPDNLSAIVLDTDNKPQYILPAV